MLFYEWWRGRPGLGLGQQPPAPSWGSMLNAAQRYLSQAPWMALYPGLLIFFVYGFVASQSPVDLWLVAGLSFALGAWTWTVRGEQP